MTAAIATGGFPAARLRRAGVPDATVTALQEQYDQGALDQEAFRQLVTTHPDTWLYSYFVGSPPPYPTPDPHPQYALRTDVPALSGAIPRGTVTIDAHDHGATGDGVTDDGPALAAALTACPEGGEVLLRPGTYLVTAPVPLRRNKALRGLHAGLWPYDTGGPVRIKASTAFTGDAVIRLQDEEELTGVVGAPASGLYVGPNDQSGMAITRLTVDGFNVAGAIDGIKATGLVRSIRLTDVTVRRCTGSGFRTVGYVRTDGLTYYPRGWRLTGCVAEANGNIGFATNLLNDSTLIDCLAVGNTQHGFYLAGPGELVMIGCRAAFNKARGYWLTGTCYGNVLLSACTTDRSEQSGVFIDTSGKHPILISGCALRRDGRNGNGGGGSYAALLVSGATNPVIVSGITTETGQDDNATGTMSPQYGLRAVNATSVSVDSGVLAGFTAPISDGGGNTNLRVASPVVLMTGSVNNPTVTYRQTDAPFPQPVDHGYAAWAYDVAAAVNTASNALTSGVLTLIKLRLTAPATISSLAMYVTTGGTGLTAGQSFGGLYSAAGALLGSTADQATAWATTGPKTMPLTAASGQSLTNLPPGTYYAALLSVGTTMPVLVRSSGQPAINQGLAAGAYRFGTVLTGQTALPASLTLANMAAAPVATWAAVA